MVPYKTRSKFPAYIWKLWQHGLSDDEFDVFYKEGQAQWAFRNPKPRVYSRVVQWPYELRRSEALLQLYAWIHRGIWGIARSFSQKGFFFSEMHQDVGEPKTEMV